MAKRRKAPPKMNRPGQPSMRQREQERGNWMNDPKVARRTSRKT